MGSAVKAGLARAKARGVKLGGSREGSYEIRAHATDGNATSSAVRGEKALKRAAGLASAVDELRARGCASLAQLAEGLDEMDIPAPRGGRWSPMQVSRLLKSIERSVTEFA